MSQANNLFLTALPNGFNVDGTLMRLTVFLSPSISVDKGTVGSIQGTPFANWPRRLNDSAPQWAAVFTPANADGSSAGPPLPTVYPTLEYLDSNNPKPLRPDLWEAIFGADRHAKTRTGNQALYENWRLSHNITKLHQRHRKLRHFHAQRALLANLAKTAPPGQRNLIADANEEVAKSINDSAPPVIYLYPALKTDDAGTSSTIISKQIADRTAALTYRGTALQNVANLSPDDDKKLQQRIDYAFDLLETQEGSRLLPLALYAIYRHCVSSVAPPGTDLTKNPGDERHSLFALYTLYQDISTRASVVNSTPALDNRSQLDVVQDYVEFLLFHRRKPEKTQCTIDTPDFHQVLGMVNSYPAILRPLGLAFDLHVPILHQAVSGLFTLQVMACTSHDPKMTDPQIGGIPQPVSNTTVCQIDIGTNTHKFFSAAKDGNVVSGRLLALNGGSSGDSVYTLVQEDADGTSLKFTDQTNNGARATEYTTSAPTSLKAPPTIIPPDTVLTPSSSAHPSDDLPAARSVGISLFHGQRLEHLEKVIAKAIPPPSRDDNSPPPTDPGPLFAEDLMLGFRVDVKHKDAKQKQNKSWLSLCQRHAEYRVLHIDTSDDQHPIPWTAITDAEKSADEGFVTFGATQSSLSDGTDMQIQLHQSLFTWVGWSLAVEKPGFETVNRPAPPDPQKCPDYKPLSIRPKFTLQQGPSLPPLRFNHDYQIRCRVVDLAGNSIPCIPDDTAEAASVSPKFSRHEPIRAPQILLTEPLDSSGSPGEHIDRLVAHDGADPAPRMLVPPRESLRLAELHNLLGDARLPDSAFSKQQLMPDGSFPSVVKARCNRWISGDPHADVTHNQDAIFLSHRGGPGPKNRFYPDPLAHYIRVKPFLVSDDPTFSHPLGLPFYIEIDPHDQWPDLLPARIELNSKGPHDVPAVDFDNNSRPPRINVNLPQGCTVVLQLSSAADRHDGRKWRVDSTMAVFNFDKDFGDIALGRNASSMDVNTISNLTTNLVGNTAAEKVAHGLVTAIQNTGLISDNASYVDGDLAQVTPTRTVTLVHAVRQPVEPPDFAPHGSAGDLVVGRTSGQAVAVVHAAIRAHWLSTGKVTCHAQWTDRVDDVTKPGPTPRISRDVAFDLTALETVPTPVPDFDSSNYLRTLKPGTTQVFRDTRAHTVTYSLSASTRFRAYYPLAKVSKPSNPPAPAPDESNFARTGVTTRTLTVLSSVRPPAPIVAYIVPAFLWRDTYETKTRTWFSGRTVLLRVYFERPFLLSGDFESVGVVLATPAFSDDETIQPLVSRWGSDPTRPITRPIDSSALTIENLCEANDPVHACQLAEGGFADIKPCDIHYAPDRKLWFADVPVNTLGSFSPFLRLALVRWQPQALHHAMNPHRPPKSPWDPNVEARISAVVITDFIQLAPDRWVSVQRRTDSVYVITVSGPFPPPESSAGKDVSNTPSFTLSLYSRWFATGRDTGWRPVDCDAPFHYSPAPSDRAPKSADSMAPVEPGVPADPNTRISSWSTQITLPHSADTRKYRILLRENEWYSNSCNSRTTYAQFVDLP